MVLRCSSRRTGTVATQTEHFQEIGTDISFLIPTNKPLHRSGVRTVSDGRFTRCSPMNGDVRCSSPTPLSSQYLTEEPMEHLSTSSSTLLRGFLKTLPSCAIASLASIAIQHPPSSETNRATLATVVSICMLFNCFFGPRPTELFACRTRPTS